MSWMYSALTGVISNWSGSGFQGRSLVSSGCSFRIRLNASAFDTNTADLIFGFDCSTRATAFSCCRVAGPPFWPLVLKSTFTTSSCLT